MAPDETFRSIAARPDWVVPLVLWLLFSLVGGIFMAQKIDFTAPAREAMAQRSDIPPDAAERAVKISAAMGKVTSYAAPVFATVIFALTAAVLLLAFRLFGAAGTYPQAFSATLYAWLPNILQSCILLIVIFARGGEVDVMRMQTVVRSNLAFLFDPLKNPVPYTLLAALDVFSLWSLVLFVIGFAAVGRTSKAKSATIVISLWAVKVLFSLVPAAIRALR